MQDICTIVKNGPGIRGALKVKTCSDNGTSAAGTAEVPIGCRKSYVRSYIGAFGATRFTASIPFCADCLAV